MSEYTANLQQIIERAKGFSQQLHHRDVSPSHLLLALLNSTGCQAYLLLESFEVNVKKVQETLMHCRMVRETMGQSTGLLSARSKLCLDNATQIAQRTGSDIIRSEHLLFGLMTENTLATEVFKAAGVPIDKVLTKLLMHFGLHEAIAGSQESAENRDFAQVCISLNDLAKQGKLDPVIGRHNEIRRAIQILGRRRKNNPVLIGDAGVGKTAIVEGIAQRIVAKTCPPFLRDKEIFIFDLVGLVSNTIFRGQMEGRVKMVLDHVRMNPNIILFIDEIHLVVGAGNSIGGMDVSNLLKPALSRGDARVVGATTVDEYNKSVAKDAALERRFQTIKVDEPPEADVVSIVQGALPAYQEHHNVRYTPEAIIAAVELSRRYLPNRRLPDKALDILDEAASAVKLASPEELLAASSSLQLQEMERQIKQLIDNRSKAAVGERFSEVHDILTQLKRLETKRDKLLTGEAGVRTVTEDHIRAALSLISGVPLEKLTAPKKKEALHLPQALGSRVIGQRRPIEIVARYIRRSLTKINDPKRPIGTLLLLGPTGVGKTLLAKSAAVELNGTEEALIQLDMSEYMEKHSVARLIGSPPGYVGYDDQNSLVERVRRNPYAVVLFDEIEKAHIDVWNVLLQILEEGKLTDGQGRIASFRNALVLLTSNLGYEQFSKGSIGFNQNAADTRDRVMDAVKKAFRPEFLNRLDEIVVFDSLTPDDCRQIIDLEVEKVRKRTQYNGILLSGVLREKLLKDGFSEEYGARQIKRTVELLVTDPISNAQLEETIKETGEIAIGYRDDQVVVSQIPQDPAIELPNDLQMQMARPGWPQPQLDEKVKSAANPFPT